MKPVRILAGLIVVGAAIPSMLPAHADAVFQLTPSFGTPGDEVAGESHGLPVTCLTYRLRWSTLAGELLGADMGSDGTGAVTFTVPPAPPGFQTVVATCQGATGRETVVSQARFTIVEAGGSTTTITLPPSTVAGTSTIPPGATSTLAPPPPPPTTKAPGTTKPPSSTTRPPGSGGSPTTSTTAGSPAPAPSGSTGSRPVPRDISECERVARDAETQLIYQPDRTMTFGKSYDVVASLALDATDAKSVEIPGPAQTTIVTVKGTRCTVEAALTGGDFDITPPGSHAQSFLDSRVLTWRWQVAPKRTGPDLKLVLRIQPTVVEEGKAPRPGTPGYHDAFIEVDSQPQSLITKVNKGVGGLFGHPLVQFLLIPSGGGFLSLWLWRHFRRETPA